jgi:hypothetical protein
VPRSRAEFIPRLKTGDESNLDSHTRAVRSARDYSVRRSVRCAPLGWLRTRGVGGWGRPEPAMSAQLLTIDPYSPPAGRKAELLRWLAEEGRFAPDTGRLLELLCDCDSPRHGARSHAPSRIPWSDAHLAAWREQSRSAPRGTVSSSRRITRTAPFSTSLKPGSGSTPYLASR